MTKSILYIMLFVAMLALPGCSQDSLNTLTSERGELTARLSGIMPVGDYDTEDGNVINHVAAFRFEDNVLEEVFNDLSIFGGNTVNIKPADMKGNLYFMVNAGSFVSNSRFTAGVTTEADFLDLTIDAGAMQSQGMLMTGGTVINPQSGSVTIGLKRSLARIDLDSSFDGVKVNSVRIKDICPVGYVFDGNSRSSLDENGKSDLLKDFGDAPFSNSKSVLFYVAEQTQRDVQVEVLITVNGAWHKLKTVLPEIRRNNVYTLKVLGSGADFRIDVLSDEWQSGDGSSANDVLKGLVDVQNSELSDGVVVNQRCDTVFVPSWKSDFSLALSAEPGAVASLDGMADGSEIIMEAPRALSNISRLRVSSARRMPGTVDQYVYVNVHKDNVLTGRVVIVFKANPVKVNGILEFDDNALCDFGRYVDGELAVITLPDGKDINLEFADDEAEWMKLEETATGEYRLLGGWKPNDPQADGREQSAKLVISDTDGTHSDVYTIKRVNWTLPVVNINGTWWCKYNLRGNVKEFTDQILIANDPAAGVSLGDYLRNCTDDEFLNILGDQYQAGNQDGLKLVHTEAGFLYDGFGVATGNFGTMDPKYMAPDGFEIPAYNDYRFFNWGNNSNLAYFDPGAFNNGLGQRLNFSAVERNAVFLGNEYGPIYFFDFEYSGEHFTLCGLGHQWSETGLSPMMALYATYGNSANTWLIEGYSRNDGSGNWFKYGNHNATKTRTIRCIKTPVEYIYQ